MKLEREDIEEFKAIYREEFGEELSDVEAERRARQLLTFYEVMAQILLEERPRSFPLPSLDDLAPSPKVKDTDEQSPLPSSA